MPCGSATAGYLHFGFFFNFDRSKPSAQFSIPISLQNKPFDDDDDSVLFYCLGVNQYNENPNLIKKNYSFIGLG